MKIILLQDVAKIGTKGTVVDVPTGYAQNKLVPKRLAMPATPANLKRAERAIAEAQANQTAAEQKYNSALAGLKANTVSISVDANEQGHLFKAVHEEDIVTAARGVGVDIEPDMIVISGQIKELGEHTVHLVHKNQKEPFVVNVITN